MIRAFGGEDFTDIDCDATDGRMTHQVRGSVGGRRWGMRGGSETVGVRVWVRGWGVGT